MQRIGQRIRSLRRSKRMSVDKLARSTGKTARYLQLIEAGDRTNLTLETLYAIARGLDVDPAQLVSDGCPHCTGRPAGAEDGALIGAS